MKTRILGCGLLLAGALSLNAQDPAEAPAAAEPAAVAEVRGDVVAADAEAKTLKLKAGEGDAATEWSLVVEGEDALKALGELKAGEAVVVGCREGTSGETCVVVSVAAAKPEASE